jgi:hypothetical protein
VEIVEANWGSNVAIVGIGLIEEGIVVNGMGEERVEVAVVSCTSLLPCLGVAVSDQEGCVKSMVNCPSRVRVKRN